MKPGSKNRLKIALWGAIGATMLLGAVLAAFE